MFEQANGGNDCSRARPKWTGVACAPEGAGRTGRGDHAWGVCRTVAVGSRVDAQDGPEIGRGTHLIRIPAPGRHSRGDGDQRAVDFLRHRGDLVRVVGPRLADESGGRGRPPHDGPSGVVATPPGGVGTQSHGTRAGDRGPEVARPHTHSLSGPAVEALYRLPPALEGS